MGFLNNRSWNDIKFLHEKFNVNSWPACPREPHIFVELISNNESSDVQAPRKAMICKQRSKKILIENKKGVHSLIKYYVILWFLLKILIINGTGRSRRASDYAKMTRNVSCKMTVLNLQVQNHFKWQSNHKTRNTIPYASKLIDRIVRLQTSLYFIESSNHHRGDDYRRTDINFCGRNWCPFSGGRLFGGYSTPQLWEFLQLHPQDYFSLIYLSLLPKIWNLKTPKALTVSPKPKTTWRTFTIYPRRLILYWSIVTFPYFHMQQ